MYDAFVDSTFVLICTFVNGSSSLDINLMKGQIRIVGTEKRQTFRIITHVT